MLFICALICIYLIWIITVKKDAENNSERKLIIKILEFIPNIILIIIFYTFIWDFIPYITFYGLLICIFLFLEKIYKNRKLA